MKFITDEGSSLRGHGECVSREDSAVWMNEKSGLAGEIDGAK